MDFSVATLARVLVATAALLSYGHAKGVDAPSPWGTDYAPDVVEPGIVPDTPKPVKIFAAPTFSDSARFAADFFIRAMPLGASITQGVASTDGNGYRKYFRDQLRFNGWKVNMVGSKQDGTMNDRDNEGHPGWIIDQVFDAAKRSIGLHPNLVMINVGTNDCIQNIDTGNAGARLRRLVDYLFDEIPGTTVLLSTLVPSLNDNNERCAQSVNTQYRSLVSSYQGKRIFLADMHAFLTRSDIDPDGIHPNDGGYKKMAAVWWDAFKAAERTLQAPDGSLDDAREVGGEASTCAKRAEQGRGPVQTQLETGYANGNYEHKSTPRGTMATVPNSQSNTYVIAQLVNAGGAGRGGEVDELVRIERQGDGSHRYSYLLNTGGGFQTSWTGFSLPACSGNVQHVFADLNNDGLDDFWCIGDRGQASVAINRGGQPPRFESIGEVIGAPGGKGPGDVLIADVDGDGRADYCVQETNGDIRCWRNGGMGDTVAYWQGFSSENTGGDVVFAGKGKPNRSMVRLGDINGDWRADWMYVGDGGEVETFINQRGYGLGIYPSWVNSGRTHGGMGTPGAGAQIRFGRVFGSGRLDYIWLKPVGNNIEVQVWQNIGDGGTRMKGDGTFYCDMTGSGSDDYIWIWSGGDRAELRINTHNPPNWKDGLPNLFNINRDRRSIHLADWDGDGKCDILSQDKVTGDLEMWHNEYNAQTGQFFFPYKGKVNGPAKCNQGWGVNIFDRGLRLADIDGDGRADYLCLEKDGRITGGLNKAGGMETVGQIKFAEGWDRANIRFADVEKGGKADMIWVNKYNGAATVLKNKGRIPAGGSAFTWEKRGVLYNSIGERGLNMNFANLGGLGRADFVQVLPITNRAYTWFNECPGGNGGGDDGAIGDPQLPPYGNNRKASSRVRRV